MIDGRTRSGARHELVTGLNKKQAMYMARRLQGILEAAARPGEEADQRGANLGGADPTAADLGWATLSGADLRGAVLKWANLRGADLANADLRKANLIGARWLPNSPARSKSLKEQSCPMARRTSERRSAVTGQG